MPRTLVCPFRKRVVLSLSSAFLVLAVAAPAQIRNRITRNIGETEPVVLRGRIRLARAEFDQGRVEGSMRINHAAMVFKLSPTQQAALDKLLAEQQDPHSSNYRKWLTPEQYAARFGMSDSDLAKVTAWLKSQGLTVDGLLPRPHPGLLQRNRGPGGKRLPHRVPPLSGGRRNRVSRMPSRSPLPEAISGMVLGFRGLENFRPRPRARVSQAELHLAPDRKPLLVPGRLCHDLQRQPLRRRTGWNRTEDRGGGTDPDRFH